MDLSPSAEARLRRIFRALNRFMLLIFRLGLGNFGNGNRYAGWIMVIKHRGRQERPHPLCPCKLLRRR